MVVAALSLWIKNIIFVVLFASFLELLLPSSSMQRFIRVIMGLFIMLAILNPVLDLLSKDWRNDEVAVLTSSNASILERADNVAAERDKLAQEVFKKDIARQVKSTVMAFDGVGNAAVNIDVTADKMNLATVHLTVYIQPSRDNSKVVKVAIGTNSERGKEELNPELKQKIRRTLVELYGLKENQLDVKLWH